MDLDLVVVGSCNIDQITYAPRLPRPGETIHGSKYETGFGGKGANQCVAAAKLGARSAMVARVGDDDNGNNYISNMERLGVDVSYMLKTPNACTGVAPITVCADGNNSIVIVSGANSLLTPKDVDSAGNLLASAKVLLCQLETPFDTTLHALKRAKQAGVFTILNPAPAETDLRSDIYEHCDIFCPNETEASTLSGIEVTDIKSATRAAQILKSKGCNACIITMGKDGCVVAEDGRSPYHVPGKPFHAIDTTGAGDAFIGALGYFMCHFKHLGLEKILERACVVAAKSVLGKGTQSSFPRKEDLPNSLFH